MFHRIHTTCLLVVSLVALVMLGGLFLTSAGNPQTPVAQKIFYQHPTSDTPSQPRLTPQTPSQKTGSVEQDDDVVRVDSDLTNVLFTAVDKDRRFVTMLRQEDIRVLEDGVPQQIFSFTRAEVPISYGLVVDNSGSMKTQLEKVVDASRTIIEQNKPGDETFLERFVSSDEIAILQDFTANKEDLIDAMDKMHTEGGQTAILDAVYLAAEHVGKHKKGDPLNDKRRRALILVTDGEDRSSFYKQAELFEFLRENDVQIYIIGFVNELDSTSGFIRKSSKDKSVNLLNKLATETGGRAFYPTSLAELPGIADAITKDLRTQYVVSYSPTNKRRDGTFRKVNVRIEDASKRDKRIAITRPGYTAPREGGTPAPATTRTTSTSNKRP